MSDKIITRLADGVFEITLNNPSKMNCMGFQMLNELNESISKAKQDDNIKVVVITGAGNRAFSSGADLNEFQTLPDKKTSEWIELGNKVFNKIENLKKPTIAFINGYAIGGGLELALSCDFRIGTESAVICSPELQHGWLPGWGGMTRLRRLVGEAKAKEIVMLCEKIPAKRALELGLLTRIDAHIENSFGELVDHLKNINTKAFELAKLVLQDNERTTYGADIQFDVLAMQLTNNKYKNC
ncbi:enoyl-CoA hydratase/isomerase family protein [Draconibacterium sp.]|nr:enoyl-CoA hydratase/isomerase family protein [Draconibacterium sp.]